MKGVKAVKLNFSGKHILNDEEICEEHLCTHNHAYN